jgi:glycosyltransferase involved in cell wall biosynthesis
MDVSVVIPALNEELLLSRCLHGLSTQSWQRPFEVIVVDNGSTDQTRRVAAMWSDRLHLRIVTQPLRGRGSARRAGFEAAETSIILSTDADSVVPTDWISRLTEELVTHPTIVAVTSYCYIDDGSWLTNRTVRVGMRASLRLYHLFRRHHLLTGSTFGVRRSAYLAAGGFDPSVDLLEDVDLGIRLSNIGEIRRVWDVPVATSGNVFRHGFVVGFLRYFVPYVRRYVARP